MGFYKIDGNEILFEESLVCGPDYILFRDDYESYSYPVEGWVWADSLQAAMLIFTEQNLAQQFKYWVEPEGFFLSANRIDETEFNKLITLLNLALERGVITTDTPIPIKDVDSISRIVTVERFLDIMVGYGFYCYSVRNY